MRACNRNTFCWNTTCAQGESLQRSSACCSGRSIKVSCEGTSQNGLPSLPTTHFCACTCAHTGHAHKVALSACCCVGDNIKRVCTHAFVCTQQASFLCCPRVCNLTKCTCVRPCNTKPFCWNMCAQGERLQVTSACCSGQSKLQRNTKQNGLATEKDIVGTFAHKAKHCKCQVLVAQVNQS